MKRTAYAQQGLDFVTLFSAKFHRHNISGYSPVLREPHAESTAGGKQAIQHMILEPKIEGDPVMTIGYVNVVTKQAKIRTYECVQLMHRMRFPGRPFAVDKAAYHAFFDKVTEFMRRQGMVIDIETRPPAMRNSSRPPGPAGSELADIVIWVLLIVIVVGTAMAAYLRITGRI